jgi:uncharacterized membrane protein
LSEPASGPLAATPGRGRIDAIDFLRGLVMVIMALDHVRDFYTDVRFDPLDLSRTDTALFFTRWITHLCAPTFVFLAGTSAYFVSRRTSPAGLASFLLTRGAWLIVLELTVVNFAWTTGAYLEGSAIYLQVIWAIGWSMVILAALVRLPWQAIGALGLLLIAGHNAFDGIAPEQLGAWAPLWTVLHVQGPLAGRFEVFYPLVPWIGVMMAGFAFGALYLDPAGRQRRVALLGLAALVVFLALRLPNLYGDPQPWSAQATPWLTVLSVLDVEKYPPSLLFLCVTLGLGLLALAAAENWRGKLFAALVTIGRVPLFFYVAHLYLAHVSAGLVALALGHGSSVLLAYPEDPAWGFGLPGVYLAWAAVVIALYPACRWFAGVKARRRDWWLSYL